MIHHRFIPGILAFVALLPGALAVNAALAADSPRSLVRRGNDRFHARQYDDARKDYTDAANADPNLLEAIFNEGVARFEQGDLDGAERYFRRVDASPGNLNLAAQARYNLGLAEMQRIRKAEAHKPDEALATLQRAASNFRAALDLDPADAEAARNLEVARREIRSLQQKIQRRKEMQEKLKDLADQLQKNEQEQNQESQRSAQRAQRQQPDQNQDQQRQQAREEQDRVARHTEELRKQAQELQQRTSQDQPHPVGDPQPGQDPLRKASDAIDRARDAQEQAQRKLDSGDDQSAQKEQEKASEELKNARESLQQQPQQRNQPPQGEPQQPKQGNQPAENQNPPENQQPQADQQQPRQPQPDAENAAEQNIPKDQAVERILEKEKRDRDAKARAMRALYQKHRPVDKDW